MKIAFKRSKILIVIIGVLFVLSLNFFQKEVKGFFYIISAPIQKTLWLIGDSVSDFFEMIAEMNNLKKENEELKLKIQTLLAENISFKEIKKENEALRKVLEIGLEKEFKLAMTEVVGKDISQDLILIDKGSKDGISKGLPVITKQKVLAGTISEVYENFSKVILVSNKESSFGAKIAGSEIFGVIKGVFFDLIPRNKEIKEGDLVITTVLGDVLPAGLLVGSIERVIKNDIKPFQQAKIAPFFDIKEIKNLFIVLEY